MAAKAKIEEKAGPFTIEKREGGVALVWFNDPGNKVNTLSTKIVGEFLKVIDATENDQEVKAVVWISGKPDCFIAGADIDEFKTLDTVEKAQKYARDAQAAFNRMAASAKIHIAAINGVCLGGGLEFAMACHYRIAASGKSTFFGQPEVKLGLLPGGGGTQRLPRLVSLQEALDMLLTGKNVYAEKARKIGLVDEVVIPWAFEKKAAAAAARLVKTGVPKRVESKNFQDRLMKEVGPLRDFALKKAREEVMKKTKGLYPAPLKIIESVKAGLEKGFTGGLVEEARLFAELTVTPESRELVNLFFTMTARKKHPLARGAKETKKAAVLGAGLMGAGIALVSAQEARTPVVLKDIKPEFLAWGEKYIYGNLDGKLKKRAITQIDRDQVVSRVFLTTSYEHIAQSDLVVEAVFEDLDLKRKVLAEVEAATGPECVFASNTSSLPISEIAKKSKRPENVLGMHYFSPVEKMPLLEIIKTGKTADWALAKAVAFGVRQGKTVIVVKDGPGFYTTRILAPYLNETCLLLEDGARIEDIDRAMISFGFPVGPVVLFDEVGINVAAHVSKFLGGVNTARRPGLRVSDGVHKMNEAGYQGRKNKKGFYTYESPKKGGFKLPFLAGPKKSKLPHEAVYAFFGGKPRVEMRPDSIADRLALVMVNEAAACLEEGIIESPADGDLGAILGLGFPPFRGGPFRWIDSEGADKIVKKLNTLASEAGPQFAPAKILEDHAKAGKKFYA